MKLMPRAALAQAALLACATTSLAAHAAQEADNLPGPAAEGGAFVKEWHGSIGLGVGSVPKYPGANSTRTTALPLGRLTYDRFFIGAVPLAGPGLGVYAYRDEHFSAGFGISHNFRAPRKESDDARLQGLGDVKATTWGSAFGEYRNDWVRLNLSLTSDIGGQHEGSSVSFEALGRYRPMRGLEFTAGPRLVWGNDKYQQTLFGVNDTQSAASGMRVYTPKAGLTQASFELGAMYQFRPQWMVGANASFGRLSGDAADSPIVEKKAQNRFGMFVGYRF